MEAMKQEKEATKKLDKAARTLNDLREPIEYGDFIQLIIVMHNMFVH